MQKTLNDFKNIIKDKYNYPEGFAQDITVATFSLIEYYGEEYSDLIMDAVESCEFVKAEMKKIPALDKTISVPESVSEILTKRNMPINKGKKINSATYISKPNIITKNGKKDIESIDRVIALPATFNVHNPLFMGELIHAMLELISSYNKEYAIDGEVLEHQKGLSKSLYSLKNNKKTFIKKIGTGLETGMNLYDEIAVVRGSYFDDYDQLDFAYHRIIGGYLKDSLKLKEVIEKAQLTHDTKELSQLFESTMGISLNDFSTMLDKLYEIETKRHEENFEIENLASINQELTDYFAKEIAPKINKMTNALQKEKSDKHVLS